MVRIDPTTGLVTQIAVLAVLSASTGLSTAGWLAGIAYGLITYATIRRGLKGSAHALTPADCVTLIRATLVGGVTALTVDSFGRPTPVAALVALAAVALCLDAVDGQVARRTGASTPFGARFDMEIDAFLILVLSVHIAVVYGAWIIVIGAMRYAFVAVGWALPWMCAQLPPRQWRKTVAAIEGIVLAVVAAEIVPRAWAMAALVVALALLVESFGRDVVWLRRHVSRGPVETPAPGRLRRTVPRRRSATTAAARTSTPRL